MHPYMVLACWQELDTKVQGLHEQRMKQLSLERECSRLRQEVDRLAVLQPLLEGQHCLSLSQMLLLTIHSFQMHRVIYT